MSIIWSNSNVYWSFSVTRAVLHIVTGDCITASGSELRIGKLESVLAITQAKPWWCHMFLVVLGGLREEVQREEKAMILELEMLKGSKRKKTKRIV